LCGVADGRWLKKPTVWLGRTVESKRLLVMRSGTFVSRAAVRRSRSRAQSV
jgi:hypothetical protein